MSLAKGTLLIGWAAVVSMGLMRIAGLEEAVKQAQAEVAGLRQEVLAASNVSVGNVHAECDQARAEVRMLHAEATGLLNKLLLSVNELPQPTHRTLDRRCGSTLTSSHARSAGGPLTAGPARSPGRADRRPPSRSTGSGISARPLAGQRARRGRPAWGSCRGAGARAVGASDGDKRKARRTGPQYREA